MPIRGPDRTPIDKPRLPSPHHRLGLARAPHDLGRAAAVCRGKDDIGAPYGASAARCDRQRLLYGKPATIRSRDVVGRAKSSSTSLDNSQSKNKECQSTHGPPVDAGPGRIETHREEGAARLYPAGNQALPGLHSRQAPIRPTVRRDRMASSRPASYVRVWDGAVGHRTAYCRQDSQSPIRHHFRSCCGLPTS